MYLMPLIVVMAPDAERQPKYVGLLGGSWVLMDYGPEPACLVMAANADAGALASKLDVCVVPPTLDATVPTDLVAGVRTKLEALHVPSAWIVETLTWREVVRGVAAIFLYMQAYGGLMDYRPILTSDAALNVQYGELPLTQQAKFQEAATSQKLDAKVLVTSSTLRDVFLEMAKQSTGRPVVIGGVTI